MSGKVEWEETFAFFCFCFCVASFGNVYKLFLKTEYVPEHKIRRQLLEHLDFDVWFLKVQARNALSSSSQ